VLGVFLLSCMALLPAIALLAPGLTVPIAAGVLPSSAWVILGGALGLFAMRRRAAGRCQRSARIYRLPSVSGAAPRHRNPARRSRCSSVPAIPFDSRSSFDHRAIANGPCRQRG
jgi:hypothetical protein